MARNQGFLTQNWCPYINKGTTSSDLQGKTLVLLSGLDSWSEAVLPSMWSAVCLQVKADAFFLDV